MNRLGRYAIAVLAILLVFGGIALALDKSSELVTAQVATSTTSVDASDGLSTTAVTTPTTTPNGPDDDVAFRREDDDDGPEAVDDDDTRGTDTGGTNSGTNGTDTAGSNDDTTHGGDEDNSGPR